MRTVLIEQLFFFQIFRFFFFQGKAEKLEKETGNISKVWKLNRGQNRRAKIFGWLRIPIFGGKKKGKHGNAKICARKKNWEFRQKVPSERTAQSGQLALLTGQLALLTGQLALLTDSMHRGTTARVVLL